MTPLPSASTAMSLFAALSTVLPASAARAPDPAPGGLRRLGAWGFELRPLAGGIAEARAVAAAGAAAAAGLREGDRVLRIAGHLPGDRARILALRRELRAGSRVALEIERAGRRRGLAFTLLPLPLESVAGCDVVYGAVSVPAGYRVRTIVTRPAGARGALPTLVFIPWLSPDPVETPVGVPDGWIQLLHGLSQRGWQVVRIEKPGVGDSEGPPGERNDLAADLAAFRAGLAAVRAMPEVNSKRLVYFGGSIGGALAPILAAESPPAALVVSGGFSRTWREHMIEFERERMTLSGRPAAEIEHAMPGFEDFYDLYLGEKLTPAQVIARRPDLAALWYDAPDGQFGRPAAYYHQLADLSMEEAWNHVSVPTLILYGEYDWIMSRAEHDHMAVLVNRRHFGRAMVKILPRTGHNLEVFRSREASFRGDDPRVDPGLAEWVADWLARQAP